jgi:hypothetical protein
MVAPITLFDELHAAAIYTLSQAAVAAIRYTQPVT